MTRGLAFHGGETVAAFSLTAGVTWRAVDLSGGVALCAALDGCGGRGLIFLDPQGPIAVAQRWYLVDATVLLLVLVLPGLIFTPWVVQRRRYGNLASHYMPNRRSPSPWRLGFWARQPPLSSSWAL